MDMHRVHGALHYSHTACGDSGEKNMGGWSPQLPVNLQDDFHNYGIGEACGLGCCVAWVHLALKTLFLFTHTLTTTATICTNISVERDGHLLLC